MKSKPKIKPTLNTADKVETSKLKLLAKIGELQLLREAHAKHIQDINGQMNQQKIKLANLEQKGQ